MAKIECLHYGAEVTVSPDGQDFTPGTAATTGQDYPRALDLPPDAGRMGLEGKESLFQAMAKAVVDMDEDSSARLSEEAVRRRYDAFEAIDQGLTKGMEQAGRLFEEEEYFVPELLLCADAMDAGVEVLKPHIKKVDEEAKCRIVLGVISGDTHDIGKNLVKLMLNSAGFEVIDLGRDVDPEAFIDRAQEAGARIIMISSLMTTTMEGMLDVVKILKKRGLRDQFKVAVGGGPVSQAFADRIGADAYSPNANHAVRLAARLSVELAGDGTGELAGNL